MIFPSPIFDLVVVILFVVLWMDSFGMPIPGDHRLTRLLLPTVAVLGIIVGLWSGWPSDLSAALRVSVLTTIALASLVGLKEGRPGHGLTVILAPYAVFVLGVAWLLFLVQTGPIQTIPMGSWLIIHIGVAILAYASLTIAAIAGLSVTLSARALKRRSGPNRFEAALPSVMEAEVTQDRFLASGGIVLGFGLLSGMALNAINDEPFINLSHKSILLFCAFMLIVALIVARRFFSFRGRAASRGILIVFLLVTLGYPGVKFVSDLLLTAP